MFNIDAGTVEALVSATGSAIWSFMPIVALYIALPAMFYIFQRIGKMLPKSS